MFIRNIKEFLKVKLYKIPLKSDEYIILLKNGFTPAKYDDSFYYFVLNKELKNFIDENDWR